MYINAKPNAVKAHMGKNKPVQAVSTNKAIHQVGKKGGLN